MSDPFSATAASARQAEAHAHEAAHSDTLEMLARAGYAVKGVLYGLIGVLALQTALGGGGQTTGTRGAIRTVAESSFGTVLLWLVAIGLVGYALWRFVQAALDPEHKGDDTEGVAKRLGYAGSGVVYAGLAVYTFSILLGGGGSGGGGADAWTATLMSQPFGVWLVGIAGAITIGIGLYHLRRAWTVEFKERLKMGELDARAERWAIGVSRFGIAARAVVFVLIGVFLIVAAVQTDPQEARGLDGVLQTLRDQPFGPYLLGLVALGLVGYGIYCFVNARYRRIPDPS
ncbi:MAG: DUF1206 domain-containing protein [Rubricoccaceae bacterium]|nr:DUF1206 domain-containing protein [Rubricoccaceae bacterium]